MLENEEVAFRPQEDEAQLMAGIIGGDWWISLPYGCVDSVGEWPVDWCATGHFHAGIDLAADCGLAIYATRGGTVVRIGIEYLGPYAVGIQDDQGLFHVYGHCQASYLQVGQRVSAGQHIADVGTLGSSSGCHLHYAVRTDGANESPYYTVDPGPYLQLGGEDMLVVFSIGGGTFVSNGVLYRWVIDEWDLNALSAGWGDRIRYVGNVNGFKGFGVPADPTTAKLSGQQWPPAGPAQP
jgi:hypothetical protein